MPIKTTYSLCCLRALSSRSVGELKEAIRSQNIFLTTSYRKRDCMGVWFDLWESRKVGRRSVIYEKEVWRLCATCSCSLATVGLMGQLLSYSVALNVRGVYGVISCLSCSLLEGNKLDICSNSIGKSEDMFVSCFIYYGSPQWKWCGQTTLRRAVWFGLYWFIC